MNVPFPLSVRLEIRLEKLRELESLHGQALAVAEKFRELCADETAACAGEVAYEIGRGYCDPLRILEAADRQAVETLGAGFLNSEERELVYYRFSDRETLLELWEDGELLTRDRELLQKYAPALDVELPRISSPWAARSADGHTDEVETDYSPVIEAAFKCNEAK